MPRREYGKKQNKKRGNSNEPCFDWKASKEFVLKHVPTKGRNYEPHTANCMSKDACNQYARDIKRIAEIFREKPSL